MELDGSWIESCALALYTLNTKSFTDADGFSNGNSPPSSPPGISPSPLSPDPLPPDPSPSGCSGKPGFSPSPSSSPEPFKESSSSGRFGNFHLGSSPGTGGCSGRVLSGWPDAYSAPPSDSSPGWLSSIISSGSVCPSSTDNPSSGSVSFSASVSSVLSSVSASVSLLSSFSFSSLSSSPVRRAISSS